MSTETTPVAARVAAAVMAVQALILMGLLLLAAYLAVSPSTRDGAHLGVWILLLVALTGLLLLLARALRDGRGWARGGTLAWNLLFLPVGWQMLNPAWHYAGVLVLPLALVGLVAAFMMPPARR